MAKKKSKKKASKKKGSSSAKAKPALKKKVRGATVTLTVKRKGAKKTMKSCDRLSIGGGRVVEICTMPKKRKKGKTSREKADDLIANREAAWSDSEIGSRASDGVHRRRKSRR